MAVVFKYKTNCSQEYAPGYVSTGINGEQGEQGEHGNSLYFVDYDLDNSYDIELALQKIENNYILSSRTTNQLNTRKYQINDLLLSSNGICYRLIKSSSTSLFTNYTFDITPLGKIHKSSYNDIAKLEFYDFTGTEIYDAETGDLLKYYNPKSESCCPTNRCNKEVGRSIGGHLDDDYNYDLYGAWIKICAITNYDHTAQYDPDKKMLTGRRYGLRIELNNVKKYTKNIAPDMAEGDTDINGIEIKRGPNGDIIKTDLTMYCPIEFPCIGTSLIDSETSMPAVSDMFSEFSTIDGSSNIEVFNTYYLSDYSMDMIHPSGNDIMCTKGHGLIEIGEDPLNIDYLMSYKTGYKAKPNGQNNPSSLKLGRLSMTNPEYPMSQEGGYIDPGHDYLADGCDTVIETSIHENNGGGLFSANLGGRDISEFNFQKYQIGGGLSWFNNLEMQREMADPSSNFFFRSKRKINGVLKENTEAGESAYFSSMDPEYVPTKIVEYVTSGKNSFYMFSRDTLSKEINLSDVQPTCSYEFRNKRIYLTFASESIDGHIYKKVVSYEKEDK